MFCNGIVCCNILSPLCFVASLNNWKQSQQTSNKSRFLPFSDHSTFFGVFLFCFFLTFCLRKFSQERNYISMSCWQRISVLSQINAWSDLSWIESLVFFQVWLLWLWGQMQESRWWCTWKGFTDWRHAAAGVWWNDQGLPHFCENQLFGAVFIQLNTCCHLRNVEKIKLAGDSDPTDFWSLCRLTA